MDSLISSKLIINVVKHDTPGVNKWQWLLVDAYKYGLGFMWSSYSYDSYKEGCNAFIEFAKLNNINNYEFYKDGNQIQDIRTGSGAMV